MYKTVRNNSMKSLPVWMLILLIIQINSIVVHFLLEDPILLSNQPETLSSVSYTEELYHLDDLSLTMNSLAGIPHDQCCSIFFDSLLTQDLILDNHFNPPKKQIV